MLGIENEMQFLNPDYKKKEKEYIVRVVLEIESEESVIAENADEALDFVKTMFLPNFPIKAFSWTIKDVVKTEVTGVKYV